MPGSEEDRNGVAIGNDLEPPSSSLQPPTPPSVSSAPSAPPSRTGNDDTTNDDGDDESILDISEQLNRPENIPIQQQSINAWHPILDPNWMIFSYLILAAIMVPFGTYYYIYTHVIVFCIT